MLREFKWCNALLEWTENGEELDAELVAIPWPDYEYLRGECDESNQTCGETDPDATQQSTHRYEQTPYSKSGRVSRENDTRDVA